MYLSGAGQAVVARVTGDLSGAALRDLGQLVGDALARGERDVVVNLERAGYVDSTVLNLLLTLARRTQARGGRFAVANVNDGLRTLFALTRLDTVFAVTTLEQGRVDRG